MGMSDRGTHQNYRYRRYVAPHAIERFRERLSVAATHYAQHGHEEMGKLLDQMVDTAISAGHTEVVTDSEGDSTLVNIGELDMCPVLLYVIVRPNRRPEPPEAIVTVLTSAMVVKLRKEKWEPPKLNTPFAKLAGLDPKDFKKPEPHPAMEAGVKAHEEVQRAHTVGGIEAKPGDGTLLIIYKNGDGGYRVEEFLEGRVAERIAELTQKTDVDDVRLARPIPFKTETKVEVKF